MQRIRFSGWCRAPRVVWLPRSLACGQAGNRTPIALLLGALLTGAPLLYAQGRTVTTSLMLRVEEENALEIQNDAAILTIRLAPGVVASLWGGEACTTPDSEVYIIATSGTFTISLNEIKHGENGKGDDEGSICLRSSDGVLHHSVPIKQGRSLTGTKLNATVSRPQSTQSVPIAMRAGRVSSAKIPYCRPHTLSVAFITSTAQDC